MDKFKTLGLPPKKTKRFAKEFFETLNESERKCEYDKLILIIDLFKKYDLLKI